jgi:hypothetical protein
MGLSWCPRRRERIDPVEPAPQHARLFGLLVHAEKALLVDTAVTGVNGDEIAIARFIKAGNEIDATVE